MKYAIGTQDFRTLRESGAHYVDKTEHIGKTVNAGRYLFLARPRRFGKSLTVSTLNELYSGSAELFGGLWAEHNWDFTERHRPVLWFKFALLDYHEKGVTRALRDDIAAKAVELGVALGVELTLRDAFTALLRGAAAAHPSGRVVVLVDEYDKPIIDYLDDIPRAEANRDELRGFYGVLKDSDPHIELVFITGVSAFSKVSLFSDLNNLLNLTFDEAAYTLVGITQAELERDFAAPLDASGHTRDEVRHWYNGYAWGEHETVYNPWSILQFLRSGKLENYWAMSGMPTFVTRLLARGGEYRITPVSASVLDLTSFNLASISPVSVLFQGGYLTVKGRRAKTPFYRLDYPNEEVRQSLLLALLGEYGFGKADAPTVRVSRLQDAFEARDLDTVVNVVDASLAAVPYQLWKERSEAMIHAVVQTLFTALGLYTRSEVSSARGRADIVVEVPDYVYVIELKIGGTVAQALAQIDARGYAQPYADDAREVVRLGMVVDVERRRIRDWGEGGREAAA